MPSARDTAGGNPLGAPSENVASVPPLLEMRGIVRRFGATVALAGVDLAARAGEIHALLGENGAGKSTLMHILSGLLRPDAGEIRLRGEAVRVETPRAARMLGIAMVHQHFTLVPAFTVAENLALDAPPPSGATALRYASLTAAEPALERAAALGWPLPAEARIAELAVGTQQRVEIVKALATDAELLIFDEPTAVLAGNEIEELFTVLRRLKAQGKAVLLIAHKLAEILAVADRVTVLRRGHRVASCLASETDARQLAVWMVGEQARDLTPPTDLALTPDPSPNAGREERSDLTPPPPLPYRPAAREGRGESESLPSPLQGEGPGVRVEAQTSPPSLARNERLGREGGGAGQAAFSAASLIIRGDRGEEAVRGLSLAVGRGEIFGIGGVDGNGQTELAEALVGLRPLVSGTMTWEGEPFQPGKRPTLGYIPPDRRRTGLAVTMTIAENLALDAARAPAFRWGPFLRRRALKQLSEMLVRQFDVRTENPNLPAASLSGGNQQKVVVARALYGQPDWIVVVNPTRGLDLHATRFVHDRLREARARGAAIVLISADLDELALLADRAAILSGGQLREVALERAGAEALGLLLGGEAAA